MDFLDIYRTLPDDLADPDDDLSDELLLLLRELLELEEVGVDLELLDDDLTELVVLGLEELDDDEEELYLPEL